MISAVANAGMDMDMAPLLSIQLSSQAPLPTASITVATPTKTILCTLLPLDETGLYHMTCGFATKHVIIAERSDMYVHAAPIKISHQFNRRDIRSKYHGNSRSNGTGGKNFITPTSGSRDNTSYKHSSSNRQSSNEKKEYIKKVLTAVMDMVDSEDTPSCDDAVENQVDDIDMSNTVLNAISSPTINESKYAAFLAALGCPKD